MKTLKLEELHARWKTPPVLVLGQSATTFHGWANSISNLLKERFQEIEIPQNIDSFGNIIEFVEDEKPDLAEKVRSECLSLIRKQSNSAAVDKLAKAKWNAVISLTSDMKFESALRDEYDKRASQWSVTVVTCPEVVVPPRSTPVYKLFGDVGDARNDRALALTQADFLRRRQSWRRLLLPLMDHAADADFVFVGTETSVQNVQEFLSVLYADRPFPSTLAFLKGDGAPSDVTIKGLVRNYAGIVQIDSQLDAVCKATQSLARGTTISGKVPPKTTDAWSLPTEVLSIAEVVPGSWHEEIDYESQRMQLVDALCRPTVLDWRPFLLELDLERSLHCKIIEEVEVKKDYLEVSPHPVVRLKGEAGIGKTLLLKRAAVALAKKQFIVLWIKRAPARGYRSLFQRLCQIISSGVRKRKKRGEPSTVVVICDDPIALGISIPVLVDILEAQGLPSIVIVGSRNSDLLVNRDFVPDMEFDVAAEFDDSEFERLDPFLAKLHGVDSVNDIAELKRAPTKDARDIVCSFWYTLPETRSQIATSLHDEYCRLGGVTGAVKAFAKAAAEVSELARHAYESVAVASRLDLGLPIEVLLRSIGLDFQEWRDMCVNEKPVWGLLYDEIDPETQNLLFRTRNHVVTNVLVELVNGGTGHAGEFRVLKRLVTGCQLANLPYRSFLVNLLVTRRRKLGEILTYEQGVELYELAIDTFPMPDKTIRHHFGNWHRQQGRQPIKALLEYERALETESFAVGGRTERDEHVRTSMAASIVDRFSREKDITREAAVDAVREQLDKATTPGEFDAHTHHVFANLLIKLARFDENLGNDEVSVSSLAEALRIIEDALQSIGAHGKRQRQNGGHIEALTQLRTGVFARLQDLNAAKESAANLYEATGSQAGFEVIARKLLADAAERGEGTEYKKCSDYLKECVTRLNSGPMSPELVGIRCDLIIRWRLQSARGAIDWEQFCSDIGGLVQTPRYREDLVKQYYHGLALFHCQRYSPAEGVFALIRRNRPNYRLKDGIRNYLVGKEGFPQRLQAEVQHSHGRDYLYCPEISTNIDALKLPKDLRDGATTHIYVGFRLTGPVAVFNTPDPTSCQMA